MADWFTRPVVHVAKVEAALPFYVDQLAFTVAWRYDEDGKPRVVEVGRAGCALILSDQWPDKVGKGILFVSLEGDVDTLRAELAGRNVPLSETEWGYRCLVVRDLDGNELYFPYPKP
jgi:uncharacterized glyoxalase superfamily protein PhnB